MGRKIVVVVVVVVVIWTLDVVVVVSYERIEIPLYIQTVDGMSTPCMQSLVRLPDILCQEENDLYRNAKEACCSDLAAMIQNGSGECSLCDYLRFHGRDIFVKLAIFHKKHALT